MEPITKSEIVVGMIVIATSYAVGRYTTPVKVITETKVVEVEKKKTVEDKQQNKKKKTTIVEVVKPTGEKETTTTIDEATDTDKKTSTTEKDTRQMDTKKEVIKESGSLSVNVLVGLDTKTGQPIYGGSVQKDILGPFTVGVFGLTNRSFGSSIGIRF